MAEVQPTYKVVDRQVGLLGGTVLLVGTVIGISVFLHEQGDSGGRS